MACVFDKLGFFCIVALCGAMWHYVALCVTQKKKFLKNIFVFFLHCGTMWHYSCIKQKLKYIAFLTNLFFIVALCGTIF